MTGPIDILLGAEHFYTFVNPGIKIERDPMHILVDSVFGWIVAGRNQTKSVPDVTACHVSVSNPTQEAIQRCKTEISRTPNYPVEEQQNESHSDSNVRHKHESCFLSEYSQESWRIIPNAEPEASQVFIIPYHPVLNETTTKMENQEKNLITRGMQVTVAAIQNAPITTERFHRISPYPRMLRATTNCLRLINARQFRESSYRPVRSSILTVDESSQHRQQLTLAQFDS